MIAVIDTSSLLAFVRYYLPFDKNGTFKKLIENKFDSDELLILDKVFGETKYISQGIIQKELAFIINKKKHIITSSILPTPKIFNLLENQFCNKDVMKLKGISEIEFESEKTRFLQSADLNLVLYALSVKNNNPIIVTEETKFSNDNKVFKKIPENCNTVNITCCTLPVLLKDYFKIDISKLTM